MKRTFYVFILAVATVLTACGGAEVDESVEQVKAPDLKGLEELDLVDFGYNLSIMVPRADINGTADVRITERGTLEIVIGMDYGIEIMFGDGDIELLKNDLKEDLVFIADIISEEENALVYTQDIPDSGVKMQNHFMYRAQVGENTFEVRDIAEREYGSGMIEKMLESAKTIKEANSLKVEA